MLNKAMEAALNDQIKNEIASAHLYLSMAAYCETSNYPGMAHWLQVQAKEELEHAMGFYRFVNDRGGRVRLRALDEPPSEFASIVDVFEQVLKHEQKVTAMIHALYSLAVAEKDYASLPFLQSFVVEQIEEEKTAGQVLAMLRMAGTESRVLLLLDRELAGRAE